MQAPAGWTAEEGTEAEWSPFLGRIDLRIGDPFTSEEGVVRILSDDAIEALAIRRNEDERLREAFRVQPGAAVILSMSWPDRICLTEVLDGPCPRAGFRICQSSVPSSCW